MSVKKGDSRTKRLRTYALPLPRAKERAAGHRIVANDGEQACISAHLQQKCMLPPLPGVIHSISHQRAAAQAARPG
jgi:hypothetical protein